MTHGLSRRGARIFPALVVGALASSAIAGESLSSADIVTALNPNTRDIEVEPASIDLNVPFAVNSAELRPDAFVQLDALAAALASDVLAQSRVEIVGHTDSSGDATHNLRLSQKRAESVRSYLVTNKGIDPGRLNPVGRGEEAPIPGTDPAAAKNRRVEIRLQEGRSP